MSGIDVTIFFFFEKLLEKCSCFFVSPHRCNTPLSTQFFLVTTNKNKTQFFAQQKKIFFVTPRTR